MPNDELVNILAARQLPQSAIGLPVEFGRPRTPNHDGSVSTEITMTEQGPNGQWFNIPTMMNGYKLPDDTVNTLFQHGLAPHVGAFGTLDDALKAARLRTQHIKR
jgi:hypothetical protein